ncbi:MAG: hypothetical protein EON59_15475 [Alphaproteobacteria bacterium]|nr:MAG: hypothetical protein EON59_15475 [Alphaproteobacteria bacterium]
MLSRGRDRRGRRRPGSHPYPQSDIHADAPRRSRPVALSGCRPCAQPPPRSPSPDPFRSEPTAIFRLAPMRSKPTMRRSRAMGAPFMCVQRRCSS